MDRGSDKVSVNQGVPSGSPAEVQHDARPHFEDKYLTCCDCGKEFLFEAGEQLFFWEHQLAPPKRCVMCRKWLRLEKKAERILDRPER